MRWISFPSPELALYGLPFFAETAPRLLRLPERARSAVRAPVWELAQQPSGARVALVTSSSAVAARLGYPKYGFMPNMARMGQSGVDCYVDGRYRGSQAPMEESEKEISFPLGGPAAARRRVDLYLPLYAPVTLLAVGVDDGAEVGPPEPYRPKLPVVYYGSSITQGGCATRPGLAYPAILSRMLGTDFVNLGFSGNGQGEPEVAAFVAEIAASCFVLDWTVNCESVEQARERYLPFYRAIRERHPDAPVIMVTPIGFISERYEPDKVAWHEGLREVVRKAFVRARADGDRRLTLVEGQTLLSPDDEDGYVDGTHPNDIGFLRMAERLRPVLRAALGLR